MPASVRQAGATSAELTEARQHLGTREDLAEGKDITASLHGILSKLDKHSDYIDPETVKQAENNIRGYFFGIGVQIRRNNIKDLLQVVVRLYLTASLLKMLPP